MNYSNIINFMIVDYRSIYYYLFLVTMYYKIFFRLEKVFKDRVNFCVHYLLIYILLPKSKQNYQHFLCLQFKLDQEKK